MHRLTVLRHAHAMDASPGVADADRPLSPQGELAARALGPLFASALSPPAQLRVSPSLRTRHTAALACGVAYPQLAMELTGVLYLADIDVLLREIATTPEDCGHLMLVGHNPGLSDLWAALGGEADFGGLAPAHWRSRQLEIDRWTAVSRAV
jgi:phosphohistidine phosphatase